MSEDRTGAPEPSKRATADELLALGIRAAEAYERPELARRLADRRARLANSSLRVVVVGEYKAGKSSLINATLGAALCPVDDDIATAIPTIVRNGDQVSATGIRLDDGRVQRSPLPFESAAGLIQEARDDEAAPFDLVELTIGRALLSSGLELIDTPGVGGLRSSHTAAALSAATTAEAAIFVTDASQELTAHELVALEALNDRCANVFIALTKCDLFPEWRRIMALDQEHLERAGFDVAIFPIASPLRWRAIELRNDEINRESGFVELIAVLRDDIVGQADLLAVDQAAHELLWVIDCLLEGFETERRVLTDPERAAALEAEVVALADRAERLKLESSGWQTTLNDGVSDLHADLSLDLRRRFAAVIEDATERVEAMDPRQSWEEFTPWLQQRVADELLENHQLLTDRTDALVNDVTRHFLSDEAALRPPDPSSALEHLDDRSRLADPEVASTNPAKQLFTGLRGSYSGLLMFSLFGGMAGVAIATPVLAGVGLLMGARQIRDERAKNLKAHRQQAQICVRKYLDEVGFVANKAVQDSVKETQRALRDQGVQQAREVQEQIQQITTMVRDARSNNDPTARLRDIEAEVARLERLRTAAEALWD